MRAATTLTITADHPALAGHFPGVPILPGVLLLDEILRALEEDDARGLRRWRIGRAKFLKPVRPGETLLVEHEEQPNGSVRFSISSAGQPVAEGTLVPDAAAGAAAEGVTPATTPLAARADPAPWVELPERGNTAAIAFGVFTALTLGRPLSRLGLNVVAAYFLAFAPVARRASRDYLRRVLGRAPTLIDSFRQIYAFATTLLDRLYLLKERHELFAVTSDGEELMLDALARGKGAFLLGAHLGSFAVVSAVGRQRPNLKVAMAMYDQQAGRLAALFNASRSSNAPEIIPLGHLQAMLRIRDCLDEGKFVGMLADRTIAEGPGQIVDFLGSPALFPAGPMRVAAALRRQVIFMTGLYRGGNRYHAVFRQIADFSLPAPHGRDAAVREAIDRYAQVLEHYCRADPYNWFNFYDFWHLSGLPEKSVRERAP